MANKTKTVVMQSAAVATGNGTAISIAASPGGFTILSIQIVGITTATFTFEGTIDGTNWVAISFTNATSGTAATTATADGIYYNSTSVRGILSVRARISAWTSGTITATGVLVG